MDYILKNGLIVDGTGEKPFIGSVIIKDGKISELTEKVDFDGENVIDVEGKVIAPGFIDIHTHSDASAINLGGGEAYINQGVTTEIGGNCGISLFPANDTYRDEINNFYSRTVELVPTDKNLKINNFEDYVDESLKNDFSVNVGLLIGHGTLRASVMGFADRKATDEEMEAMKKSLEDELNSGAFGMSLGLIYPPSTYGDLDEFVELGKVLKKHDAILAAHIRNEGPRVFESVEEMIEIGRRSEAHVHVSHLKLMGTSQWGRSDELLKLIDDARSEGVNITADQYPYEASSTGLTALVPSWALSGGNEAMLKNLEERSDRLISDIENELKNRGGADRVLITHSNGTLENINNKTLAEISEILDKNPVDSAIEVLLNSKGEAATVYFSMNEEDILNIMRRTDIALVSDGDDFNYDIEFNPHPRNFGTFPKFFQTVREHNLMPIESAVYKATGLPASMIGIKNRGILKAGNIADITVFDVDRITDNSRFEDSKQKPSGIEYVFVAGECSIFKGEKTDVKNGVVVRK